MINYVPAQTVACALGVGSSRPYDYLPLFEHVARAALAKGLPYETLVNTSAINLREFARFASQPEVVTTLAKVFLAVGEDSRRGELCRAVGLRRWADLARPIRIRGRESWSGGPIGRDLFHDVRERRLKAPGPNEYHPDAVYGQDAWFQFGAGRRPHWVFGVSYGYSRGGSGWRLFLAQGREALSTFVRERVPAWIESVFEPDAHRHARLCRNRSYDRIRPAVDELWWGEHSRRDGRHTSDMLAADLLDAGKRVALSPRRLAVLRRWRDADAAARKESNNG